MGWELGVKRVCLVIGIVCECQAIWLERVFRVVASVVEVAHLTFSKTSGSVASVLTIAGPACAAAKLTQAAMSVMGLRL